MSKRSTIVPTPAEKVIVPTPGVFVCRLPVQATWGIWGHWFTFQTLSFRSAALGDSYWGVTWAHDRDRDALWAALQKEREAQWRAWRAEVFRRLHDPR